MSIDAGRDEPRVGPAAGTVRLRLDLAYEGTDFHGWAAQPGLRTVQAELEAALAQVLRVPARLVVAGRTDAGVHARGQVAHVDVAPEAVERQRLGRRFVGPGDAGPGDAGQVDAGQGDVGAALVRRLAGVLPPDVRVRRVTVAPAGFDARFGALWRRYTYRLCDAPGGPDPLLRRHVVTAPRTLDVDAMAEAARGLLGEHDFAAYCRRREGATTVRTLLDLDWRREPGPFGELIVAGVRADAFCHNQVRAMVGACLAVGEGRRDVGWPARVLLAGVRDPRVTVAPAHGLTLEEVAYPDDAELAARSVLTRRRRTLPERAATPGESG